MPDAMYPRPLTDTQSEAYTKANTTKAWKTEIVDVLLAVDLGVRTGLALYKRDGRLRLYRSRNFGNTERLRRGASALLDELGPLDWLILEGGGPLATIWEREAKQRHIATRTISAEDWRTTLLYPREHRGRLKAKHSADELARNIIAWSKAKHPTSLRHDAAEAILIGLWAVLEIGWLENAPVELRR